MAGFTIMDDGSWTFSFEDNPEVTQIPDISPSDPNTVEPPGYLSKPENWKNYTDMVLYEVEVLLRQFLEKKTQDPKWNTGPAYYRRNTAGMIFQELYGRKSESKSKEDNKRYRRLAKLLAYYSTRIQKEGSVRGKKYTKTIYTLSLKRYREKAPYSLKLRVEWLASQGKLPVWQNMRLPKDDLEPGHARNPRTDENMRKRREDAKRRYNEKYQNRKH